MPALKYYTNCMINEWVRRGKVNNLPLYEISEEIIFPWFTTWTRLHKSHQTMLLRKNPFHYSKHFVSDPEYIDYGYIWPYSINIFNVHAPLKDIAAPIPKDLISPKYCLVILKTGNRKNETCNILLKKDAIMCGRHCK